MKDKPIAFQIKGNFEEELRNLINNRGEDIVLVVTIMPDGILVSCRACISQHAAQTVQEAVTADLLKLGIIKAAPQN